MPPNDFDTFCEQNRRTLAKLSQQFADYEPLHGFDAAHLQAWLRQFQAQHRSAAIKLATALAYYSINHITTLMPPLKKVIDAQILAEKVEASSVFYVPLGRVDESGTDVVRRFRNTNQLHSRKSQFVTIIELPEVLFKARTPVVFFMDDFVGTGEQVSNAWGETLCQVIPDYIPMYLAVVAAFEDGIRRIEAETPLRVLCVHTLGRNYQLMESAFRGLSNQEKSAIKAYCDRADNQPLGFGDRGLLVSFAFGTPNNTISVIRGSKGQDPWLGLLPRWEDLP